MSLASGARLGSYEILSAIGAGEMGEVWKARDTQLADAVPAPTTVMLNWAAGLKR